MKGTKVQTLGAFIMQWNIPLATSISYSYSVKYKFILAIHVVNIALGDKFTFLQYSS